MSAITSNFSPMQIHCGFFPLAFIETAAVK